MIGPKKAATLPVPAALDHEQSDQDRERDRHHIGLEGGRRELQALHRREHRDRRRDARRRRRTGRRRRCRAATSDAAPPPSARCGERHERQRAALALVVGPQQDEDVLDRDDEHERPQDQRQHAEDHLAGHGGPAAGRGGHRLAEGVERARADIAVDDAEGRTRVEKLPCMGSGQFRTRASTCPALQLRTLRMVVLRMARRTPSVSAPGREGRPALLRRPYAGAAV